MLTGNHLLPKRIQELVQYKDKEDFGDRIKECIRELREHKDKSVSLNQIALIVIFTFVT